MKAVNIALTSGDCRRIIYDEEDYIIILKTLAQAVQSPAAMTREKFRKRYDAIDVDDYGFDLTDEDFEYTREWLQHVTRLYQTAAAEGRHVLCTADQ
ncbi:YfbM family protein [Massilia sp. PAMC28688]|uniref:DUF1877 family protein n=1 Tax=Massilia sp. PAMC28688 TaxID=2861283 RepID=UPI001C6387AE|nr:DUF1877 family protein [Massilia sp. PAMC28688]QYF94918.1 YfbM family protein [Massilia sp. PAMC28688]